MSSTTTPPTRAKSSTYVEAMKPRLRPLAPKVPALNQRGFDPSQPKIDEQYRVSIPSNRSQDAVRTPLQPSSAGRPRSSTPQRPESSQQPRPEKDWVHPSTLLRRKNHDSACPCCLAVSQQTRILRRIELRISKLEKTASTSKHWKVSPMLMLPSGKKSPGTENRVRVQDENFQEKRLPRWTPNEAIIILLTA
jgi:hypothetical protein